MLSAGLLIRLASGATRFAVPPVCRMYSGGALGLLSIGLMALLVRRLCLLLLGLSSTAGQLAGSLLFKDVIPGTATTLHAGTVVGTVLGLVAAAIAAIRVSRSTTSTISQHVPAPIMPARYVPSRNQALGDHPAAADPNGGTVGGFPSASGAGGG